MELSWAITRQILWAKTGNPREGGREGGRVEGRDQWEAGGEREGPEQSRLAIDKTRGKQKVAIIRFKKDLIGRENSYLVLGWKWHSERGAIGVHCKYM